MSFKYTVQLNDPNHLVTLGQDAALKAGMEAAATDWSQYLNGLGSTSIDIQINVAPTTRAGATAGAVMKVGTNGARDVLQMGTLVEMLSGTDPNGSDPDVIVIVDPSYLRDELWFPNLDPTRPSLTLDRTDGVSVLRHELGHSLGIIGYRDATSGDALPPDHESTWDRLVQHVDGSATASFIGANARAVYGGDVPVTTNFPGENYSHLGNVALPTSDVASNDLMNGVAFNPGTSYQISPLDIAILKDLADTNVPLTPTFLGQVGDVGIYRLDLAASGLSSIQSITIRDDNIISGGTGGASGFDLDFIELSNTFTSSASTAASLLPGLNFFDFSSGGVTFHSGILQTWHSGDPDLWHTSQLFGTTGGNLQQYSQSLATLNTLDGSNANSNGDISLGEAGSITFRLTQSVTTQSRYLYFGDVGGGNDGSYVVVGAGPAQTQAPGIALIGTSGGDDLRLGIGANANVGAGDDTINGGAGDDQIAGAAGNDMLLGGTGNDQLDGGPGRDLLFGGPGDDIYFVDNVGDVVTENAGEGTDIVLTLITGYTLPANVEIGAIGVGTGLTLTGNDLDNILFGYTGNDTLTGGAGNDTLNGELGADIMIGGLGDDVYDVDNLGDQVIENPGQGTDLVLAFVSGYILPANVEMGGVGVATGTTLIGNNQGDILFGYNGNDTLIGGTGNDILNGVVGNDTMAGGQGDDIYIVDSTGDVVQENPGQGNDIVWSLVSYTLPANVEILALGQFAGPLNGTGNSGNNVLIGNESGNTLNGGAGDDVLNGLEGADMMIGGTGNDGYIVDNFADAVIENFGEGTDTVWSFISYTLAANVENLALLPSFRPINATGNNLTNYIVGNESNNVLTGGGGDDVFAFRSGGGRDTVADFTSGHDLLDVTGVSVFHTFADIQSHVTQSGANTVITIDANTSITLANFQLLGLTAHDFLFG